MCFGAEALDPPSVGSVLCDPLSTVVLRGGERCGAEDLSIFLKDEMIPVTNKV